MPRGEGLSVGISAEARVGDRISQGDFQPTAHGQPGARLEFGYFINPAFATSLSGYFGGNSLRYKGLATAGKLEQVRWDIRAGLDHYTPLGLKSRLFVGAAYVYGEARSWLANPLLNADGPRNYLVGGSLRVGSAIGLAPHFDLRTQADVSVLWGRATGVVTTSSYRWIGSELGIGIGMSYSLR